MSDAKPSYESTGDLEGEELTLLGSFYMNEWPYVLVESPDSVEVRLAPVSYFGHALRTVVIASFFAGMAWLAWDSLLNELFVVIVSCLAGVLGTLGPIVAVSYRRRFLARRDPFLRRDRQSGIVTVHAGAESFPRDRVAGVLLLATRDKKTQGSDVHAEAQLVVTGDDGLERRLIAASGYGLVANIRSPFLEFCQATEIPLYEASHGGLLGRGERSVRKLVA